MNFKRSLLAPLKTVLVLALLLFSFTPLFAQEGHPFNGTWRGYLDDGGERTALLLIMNYDGDNIQGTINPGRNSMPFLSAELDAPSWVLSVAAESRSGEAISFEGVLREVGAPNRYIQGSWNQDGINYNFRVNRE